MNPNPKAQETTRCERIYRAMVRLYPLPFRDAFGREMEQVFREQMYAVREQSAHLGLLRLWLGIVADFVWTCPKEHIVALPSLPHRTWEHVVRQPIWVYPTLLAGVCLLFTIAATYSMTQMYASSVELELRKQLRTHPMARDPFFLQNEFQKITSKASLYPVIEAHHMGELFRERFKLSNAPTLHESYEFLLPQVTVSQQRNTELIEISVYDQDRTLAKDLANAIADSYRKWKLESAYQAVFQQHNISPEAASNVVNVASPPSAITESQKQQFRADLAEVSRLVSVINPAQEALRAVRPNRKLNIAVGTLISGTVAPIAMCGLWIVKRNRQKHLPPNSTAVSA